MFLLILGVPGHSQNHMKSTQLSILYWQRTWYIDHWSSAPRMPFPGHFLKIYRTLEKCGTATFSWWTQLLVQMLPTNCMWKQKLLCEVDLRVLLCLVVWDRPQAGTALFLIIGSPTHPPPLARGYLTHILSWHKQWTGKPCTPIMALILYPLMLQLLWHHLSSLHVCFIFQNQRNSLFIVGNR